DEFSFPFPPYDIQVSLMHEIRKCIEGGKVGIFESPTGTGKSLSTICATLTWLECFEREERAQLEKQLRDAEEIGNDEEDDWVAAYKKKFEARRQASGAEEKLQNLRRVDERLKQARSDKNGRKRRYAEDDIDGELPLSNENDGDDDPDKDIALDEEYSSDNELTSQSNEEEPSCTKIFYASRTHSQLQQFASEILKTRFRARIVTVGSRQALCVNDVVRSLKHSHLINEKCDELRQKKNANKRQKADQNHKVSNRVPQCSCPYWRADPIEDLTDQILSLKLPTVSKVVQSGKALFACPYFASRNSLAMCQVVLLPYQVLLHKATREAWGVNLEGNVVIIDEAHNLLQTIAAVHSVELSHSAVTVALSLIRDYIERFRSRLKAKNLLYIRQLLSLTRALGHVLSTYSSATSDSVFSLSRFLVELDCFELNFFKLLHYMEKTRLCKKFHGFFIRYRGTAVKRNVKKPNIEGPLGGIQAFMHSVQSANQQQSSPSAIDDENVSPEAIDENVATTSSSPLYLIKHFTEALTTKCSDARIIIERATEDHPARFKFLLLNPAEKLKDIVGTARSVILIGGTMEPAQQLLHSLNTLCEVPSENIVRFSCGHVIDDNQLVALSLGKGPAGQELSLTYANRSSPSTLSALSMCLLNLMRHVPHGAVVFFPSYDYMALFEKTLKEGSLFDKFQKLKLLLFESRSDSSALWNEFVRAAHTPQGAMLCAVVGGKLSEGINFSDDLGRCVVMIGLPYPNKNNVELVEKMKYLDTTLGSGAGSELYETSCIHAVNQAIGRAIRHRHDYAAIVLIDSRYSQPNIQKGLPGWISSRLKQCSNFGELISRISAFFKMRKNIALSS
uniref:Helicase ATP-binding domain-containing protein n=2 Tax=Parascaris univalens TaxID=6257 RepID=A0A915BZN0_PARUN